MTKLATAEKIAAAIRAFYEREGKPGRVTRLLQRAFDKLSLERRLFLARATTIDMTRAVLRAKQQWGDEGNIVVHEDSIAVGVGNRSGFIILGIGSTWEEAFADAGDTRVDFTDHDSAQYGAN